MSSAVATNVKVKEGGRSVRILVRIVASWSVRGGIVNDQIGVVRTLGRERLRREKGIFKIEYA